MASSLSLSFAAVYTKEQMENNFTGVLFLGAHFFSYNLLRALVHKVDTISFLTTLRPFERVLARRNECTKALLVVFPRKEREREAVFFARVFSPSFFFLIKVSSSSLERKNAKKNARVCFVKKEEEEECERVLFVSFRKERRSTRSPSPERGAFLRRKVASARVLYNERPSFFSSLIFLSKKKCSGKMRHKNRRHHRRLNAKRRRRRRRPRRNRKREKKRTTTRRTTTPPFIFLF